MSAIAEHLKRVGWIKGQMYDRDASDISDASLLPCCLYGALSVVVPPNYRMFVDVVMDTIYEQYSDRLRTGAIIPDFNDHEDTTFEDVLLVLEKAEIKMQEQT
jgi:hypothetical protein